MRPGIAIFLLLLQAARFAPASAQTLPAFPGAEGFGSIATGGRGGDVYYVTNRNSSGAGSFAYGVQNAPAAGRTIVFAVSGHIRLPSGSGGGLSISKNKITVAGQTAPGDGICFWNNTMNLTGNDLVIRHIRWRYGKQTAGGDSVDIANSQRVILDHCDVMFSTDENISSFGTPPEFFTFQWSVNAWGLSGHSCGGLWDINHASAHHTLWANNHTRNPKCISPSVFDWTNNVTFGWNNGFNMAASTDAIARVNIRGSWFIHGGSTTSAVYGGGLNETAQNIFHLHMGDSALDGSNNGVLDVTRTNHAMVNSTQYNQVSTPWPQTIDGNPANPVIGVPVTLDSRNTARKKVLSQAGATRMEIGPRPLRDEITQLCVDRTAAMQRGIISDPLELNLSTGTAFADLQSSPAPADTDLDGMPDDWEDAVGYNKAVANNNTVLSAPQTAASFFPPGSPAGYTQLEEYLHFKAVPHGTVAKNTIASPSFIDIDLGKFTSGFTSPPVFTLSNVTNGTITQSGSGGALVRFTPTTDFSGRGGFLFTVTDSEGDSWTQQCCLLISTKTQPRPVTWTGDGVTNNWDATSINFASNTGPTAFAHGDAVSINDTGSNDPTMKLQGTLLPALVSVSNSLKNFSIAGPGAIGGTAALAKSGAGTLTLTSNNSYSGGTLVDGGTLVIGAGGSTGNIGSGQLTIQNDGIFSNTHSSGSHPTISAPIHIPDGQSATLRSGNRISLTGGLTGSGDLTIENQTTVNRLDINSAAAAFSGNLIFTRTAGAGGGIRTNFSSGFNGFTNASVSLAANCLVQPQTSPEGNTFPIGSLNGAGQLQGGSAGMCTYSIGGLNASTTFSGAISGNAALTKTGSGTLTLAGNSTHSGATNINAGSLELLGSLGASPVTVATNATLSGTGAMGGSLATVGGGIIAPGAENGAAPGTLTAASLNLVSPALRFDLSNNPATNNDRIEVSGAGAISLSGPHNFIFNLTNGSLAPGTYDLITTTGTLTASNVTLGSNLPTGTRQSITLEHSPTGTAPGYVRLVVSGTNADLTWTGANGAFWDQQTTAAWSGATPATFYNFDNVSFTDAAGTGSVTITQPVAPRSIIVDNTAVRPYTITGAPITGTTSLVKSGSGALTLNLPRYDLQGCSITNGSPTAVVPSTAGILPGMTVISKDVPAAIPPGTTVVSLVNATTVTLSQNASATSATARLIFETRNTFSGGTILNAGSLTLASNSWEYYSSSFPPPSNPYGLGTGPITLNGGTLTLLGHSVSTLHVSGPLPNDLIVPAGKTATLRSVMRGTYQSDIAGLRGNLTGSGTLNLVVNFAYGSITGDWSAFSGTLNVSRATSGANDPRFQLGRDLGLPLATVNLDQVTLSYTAVPSIEGVTVPIGSLSGNSASIIAGAETGFSPVIWRVGSLNTSTTFAGNFTPYGNAPIGIQKTGTGTWTLTGPGTVSAGVTVEQGTLSYGDASSDTLSGASDIAVNPTATLQLNSGAKIIGSSCEVFTGGTLRGIGTLQAPLTSSGTVSILGGTLNLIGNTSLDGTLEFSSLTDRLAVTGNLELNGILQLPASGLSPGRKVLATYSGALTLGNLEVTTDSTSFFAVPDTGIPGEIAVQVFDLAAYQSWQATHFGSTANPDGQPSADPDNDGMTNIEEYEAGTDPNLDTSFIPLVWQGGGSNVWDLATTANWLENTAPRVFRDKRHAIINDAGLNSPAIDLTGSLRPGSLTVSNSSKAFTLTGSGSLDGSGALSKSGANTLTLATSNNYSGPTTINAGVVNIQTATALGSAAGSTTVAANARLELQNNITVIGETLTLSGTGGTSFFNGALNSKSGVNTWAGPVSLASTGTRVGAQAGASLIISGPITSAPGGTGLTIRPNDMTATVVLSGPNTYTGDTAIIGGVLKLGASNTLPIATSLKFGLSGVSGKLDLAGSNQEIAGLAVISGTSNEITSATPATLTVNSTSDSTFAAPITGSAGLAKSGPATLALTNASTYTGPTTVIAGKLVLDLSAVVTPANLLNPVSPLILGGGTLELKGKPATSTSQTLGDLTLAPGSTSTIVLTPNGATSASLSLGNIWTIGAGASLLIDLSAGNCAVVSDPPLTGWLLQGVSVKDNSGITGPATVVAGQVVRYVPPTLTISSNDSTREFSSLNSTYPGGTLIWTDGGILTNRVVHRLILDTTLTGGTIDLGAPANVLTLTSGEIQFLGGNDLILTGGQIGANGSAVSLTTEGNNTLTLASPISGGAGSLSIAGTANVILNTSSSFTGGLTLNGGSLKQGVANALGSSSGTLTILSGTLDLNGIATGIGSLTGPGGSVTSATAATLTLGNNNASGGNFAGSIGGNIALAKTGTGTQILSGNNPYTGLTTISSGTLRSGSDNALGNGDLTVNGGTLDLQAFSDSVAALTLTSGSISGTTGLLNATSYSLVAGSISARLGGALATLAKSGSSYTNTVTLSGANAYGGATTLGTNSGSLLIAHNQALGNTPAVDVLGGGTALVLAHGITITGKPITLRGTGANNGSNAGSFSGSLTTAANATATWTGSITLGDSNGRLGAGINGTLHVSGPILGGGPNQNLTLSSGSGASIGAVVLSGSNNFTGNISIVRGALKLGAHNTLPATAIIDVGSANVTEATTFDLNGFSQTLAGLRRSGTNSTQVSTVTNSSSTPATLTLDQPTSLTYSGRITGNLTLAKSGAGTLTFSGGATLDPAISIALDGGVLNLSSAQTITALRINGVWQPAGTYTSSNSSGRIGSGSLLVTTNGPSGFSLWIDGFTTLSPGQKLSAADPDQDGVSNLLEYVLNGIPTTRNSSILPAPSLTPTHFVFTFTRREESAATTIQIFEYGSSPGTWTPVNITSPAGGEISLGPLSGGIRTVTVSIPRTAAVAGKLFGRLKVTQP